VFWNRVVSGLFVPRSNREEIIRGWKILLTEELHSLSSFSDIISVMKSRCMWWSEHTNASRLWEMHIKF
jgi:hypothetical protein